MHSNNDDQISSLSPKVDAAVGAYAAKFGILSANGKACVIPLGTTDVSRLMQFSDFEKLHRKERVWADGKVLYPAKLFLDQPPEHAKVFYDGLVFKPNGDASPTEYNLFRGLKVNPDPSGDCSLVYDLLREVWAGELGVKVTVGL